MSDGNGSDRKIENVIIIGSGPAGYTAALYTSRADLEPLVFEGFAWGGLLQQTTDVENYPGYREGVMGPEMMQEFRDQAERFGTRFVTDDVTRVELSEDGGMHKVYVGDEEYLARSVILAMGAEPKKLGVPGEDELAARGVSYCATCDAAFFRDKPTIVVGGGDTAMEDATFLAKFAKDVKIIHRRDEFRASKVMLNRAEATDNIELLTPYVIDRFEGGGDNGALKKVFLENTEGGEDRELEIDGAFIAIGHKPNSDIVTARWTPTTTATWTSRAGRRGPSWRACSPPATSWTTPTARRSPPPARAVPRPSTPRRTCATRPLDPEAHWGAIRTRWGRRREGRQLTEVWTNWAGEQRCAPVRIERPGVRGGAGARSRGRPPRAGGPRGRLGPLVHRHRVHRRGADRHRRHGPGAGRRRSSGLVTVQAGITLHELGEQLAELGLAMENQGDIDAQTLAGAISTATHGTGARYRNISSQVEAVRLVTASGEVLDIGAGDPDLLGAARVGLGALGAISAVTLRAVPIFTLGAATSPCRWARCWTTSTATPTAPTTSSSTCSPTPTSR